MWEAIFFFLFVLTLAALIATRLSFNRRLRELERARVEIQVEEDRVFDFLHLLGEAFSEGVRSSDLHRLIVEGASRILDAHGGALYLADKTDSHLNPAFISKGCPPLITVPQHILEQAATMPVALESYLRLHSIRRGEGVLGDVWRREETILLNDNNETATDARATSFHADSVLAGPLIYRRRLLGVLAVANGAMSTPFNKKDLTVFKMIAEQSAFALFSESVYLDASEKKRMDRDLQIAREIQAILLPADAPSVPGYEISGINIPARQVSGDYFDYVRVDATSVGVAIADVSGKGVPASLIMAMCRSVLRSQAAGNLSSSAVLRAVNRQLYPDIKEDMFISMAYLVLDPTTHQAVLSRAGHDAPLLYRESTGEVEPIKPPGMALGIDSGDVFDRVTGDVILELQPGDCLLLYTDGSTEALDENGLEFGLPRLTQSLQASAPDGAAEVIRKLADDLKTFAGNYPQHDDITLIAIRRL